MSLSVFHHCITIALFCVAVMVSAHLCVVCCHFCCPMTRCFKVMSLSEFYLNRAPFRLRVVPHFFSGVIFTCARVSLALLSLRKNGELLVV